MTEDQAKRNDRWEILMTRLEDLIGKKPDDLKSILFLIGVQELGMGMRKFSKEEKRDLLHIAICKVLSYSGYYEEEGVDEDGWPHWKPVKKLPTADMLQQEALLQNHILIYFEKELNF